MASFLEEIESGLFVTESFYHREKKEDQIRAGVFSCYEGGLKTHRRVKRNT